MKANSLINDDLKIKTKEKFDQVNSRTRANGVLTGANA